MTSGTVRDIRTGRAIAKTDSLTESFTLYVLALVEGDTDIYVVHGRCQHRETREMYDRLMAADIRCVYDRQMPSDRAYLFEGEPEELGFAS